MKTLNLPLDSLEPNPYRDFNLNPINEENILGLIDSYSKNDEIMPVAARVHPDDSSRYQLVFGHHRVETRRRMGEKTIRVELHEKLTEEQLVQWMVDENLRQYGNNPAAYIDAVAAVTKLVARMIIPFKTWKKFIDAAEICRMDFFTEHEFNRCRTNLINGSGLGRRFIGQFIGESISRDFLTTAIVTLKQTGAVKRIVGEIVQEHEREIALIREEELRLEKERKQAEAEAERKRIEAEKKAAAEQKRIEAEEKEAKRQAKLEEKRRRKEAKLAAEKAKAKAKKIAELAKRKEAEERAKAEEERKAAEAKAERKRSEEAARIERERQEEEANAKQLLEEQKRKEKEDARKIIEKKRQKDLEEKRKAEEAAAELAKKAAKAQQEQKINPDIVPLFNTTTHLNAFRKALFADANSEDPIIPISQHVAVAKEIIKRASAAYYHPDTGIHEDESSHLTASRIEQEVKQLLLEGRNWKKAELNNIAFENEKNSPAKQIMNRENEILSGMAKLATKLNSYIELRKNHERVISGGTTELRQQLYKQGGRYINFANDLYPVDYAGSATPIIDIGNILPTN